MKKYLFGPAVAAVAMFAFGAIYWMSPFPYKVLKSTADDSAAGLALAQLFPVTGTYLIPGATLAKDQMTALYERGPSATVQFVKEGHPAFEPAVLVQGYLHYFVVSLLLAVLLVKAAPSFHSYGCRVKFSTFVGVTGAVLMNFSDPIWWHHPWPWHLVCALYNVLIFVIGGLVLGKFVMDKTGAPPAAG